MIMLIYVSFPSVLYLIGIISFISNRKHLLSMLLILEYIVLCLFMFLFLYLLYSVYDLYFSMIFLVFSVCEGALGLSILVSMVRTHGSDYFQAFNVLQC